MACKALRGSGRFIPGILLTTGWSIFMEISTELCVDKKNLVGFECCSYYLGNFTYWGFYSLFIFTLLTSILKDCTSPGVAFTCSPVPDTWMYERFCFRLINDRLMAYLRMEINHGSIGGWIKKTRLSQVSNLWHPIGPFCLIHTHTNAIKKMSER